MKIIYILILLLLISCSIGPIPIYDEQPILSITCNSSSLAFNVPDNDGNGWNAFNWNDIGSDTALVSFNIALMHGQTAYITKIKYTFYANNNAIDNGTYEYLMPIEIPENDTITVKSVELIVNEHLANDIDTEDGTRDMSGNGLLEFIVYYTDEKGASFSSVPIRIDYTVSN